MKFSAFLYDRKYYILSAFISSVFLYFILSSVHSENHLAILGSATVWIFHCIPMIIDFISRREFYKGLRDTSEKYGYSFLRNTIEEPDFFDGQEMVRHLNGAVRQYDGELRNTRNEKDAYRDFISMWVHEVKTPIASATMTLYSMKEDERMKPLLEDLKRIEDETEKVLYFSKKDDTEKDYRIREVSVKDIVSHALKHNSKSLIKAGFRINTENLDTNVFTDIKWMSFVLGQLISNALKYRSENPELSFSVSEFGNSKVLKVSDNGIGISSEDEGRIFDRGFTGKNTHDKKSTGYGLYIVKTLLNKLGLDIKMRMSETTDFLIIFPVSSHAIKTGRKTEGSKQNNLTKM